MEKNVSILYRTDRKNKEKIFNGATISLNKHLAELLALKEDERKVYLEYKNNEFSLKNIKSLTLLEEKTIKDKDKLVFLSTIITAIYDKLNKSYKISIPFEIAKEWDLESQNKVFLFFSDNEIVIKKKERNMEIKRFNPKEIQNKLPIFTVKVEKGGVGKTFISTTLASGLAEAGFKVLILTTDPQNNVVDMLLKKKEEGNKNIYIDNDKKEYVMDYAKGLKYFLKYEKGEIISLRKNLDFIPLESPLDNSKTFIEKIGRILYLLKEKYDYDCVVIDSVPTRKVDEVVLEYTNKLIIPAYGDLLTINGVVQSIQELGVEKVAGIIFNRFKGTSVEKKYYNEVKAILDDTNIFFPNPIPQNAKITEIIDKQKTIWECKSSKLNEIKITFEELIKKLVLESSLHKNI